MQGSEKIGVYFVDAPFKFAQVLMKKTAAFTNDKRLHIFIADDDPDDIAFFESALNEISGKIKITKAKNGEELLEFIQIVVPDMIFLDINMPCMNGMDCLEQLRRLPHVEKVPIIIYSTATDEALIERSYKLGGNLYIKKPVFYSAIRAELARILALSLRDLVPQPAREKYFIEMQEQ